MKSNQFPRVVLLIISIFSFSLLYIIYIQSNSATTRHQLQELQQELTQTQLRLLTQQQQPQPQQNQSKESAVTKSCPPPPNCASPMIVPTMKKIPTEEECKRRFGELSLRKIYTYHQPIEGFRNDTELIEMWKTSWRARCWQPIVLDESDAIRHEQFSFLDQKLSALPTVNFKLYERACYIRYLALSAIGGGVSVDNDVINMGFWPSDVPDPLPDRLHVSDSHIPTLMYATAREYDRVIHWMANYNMTAEDHYRGRPHISDMWMMVKLLKEKMVEPIVENPFFSNNNGSKKLVHVSTEFMLWVRKVIGIEALDKKRLTAIALLFSD